MARVASVESWKTTKAGTPDAEATEDLHRFSSASSPGSASRPSRRDGGSLSRRAFLAAAARRALSARASRLGPGRHELAAANRLACNGHLRDAVQQWAFCSLRGSGWAREFYDAHRSNGNAHHAALRALGNRWLEVLWHCLTRNVTYDEAVHVANRNRTLGLTSKAA